MTMFIIPFLGLRSGKEVEKSSLRYMSHAGKCAAGGWRLLSSPVFAQPCLPRQVVLEAVGTI